MWSRARGVALILGVGTLAAAMAPAASQGPDPGKDRARERLGLARQALGDLERMYKIGQVTLLDPRFAVWERRQVEAVRDAGANRAEFLAALEGHVKHLRDRQRLAEAASRSGQASHVDILEVRYQVLDGETWLEQEKTR